MEAIVIKEKTTLGKEDFDLTKKYELFDVIYVVDRTFDSNNVASFVVIGHELKVSIDKRNFDYLLCSDPIEPRIMRNQYAKLSDFPIAGYFVSTSKMEVIEAKRALLSIQFDSMITKLGGQE